MKKLFASVPMRGRTEEEIRESFAKMKRIAEAYEGEELELIDTWIAEEPPEDVENQGVWYLGKSLEMLSTADVFIGVETHERFMGCEVENHVAYKYGIPTYFVEPENVFKDWREIIRKGIKATVK